MHHNDNPFSSKLQQHLPFTVLKPNTKPTTFANAFLVATALTVYGIETHYYHHLSDHGWRVATALTVYGIETKATAVAVPFGVLIRCNSTYRLRY